MGRPRTTGCKARHAGGVCAVCNLVRKRRQRARRRREMLAGGPVPRPFVNDYLRAQQIAYAYVAVYRRRGAIVPADACERCHSDFQISVRRPRRHAYAWHPDPRRPREIAWLCRACRSIMTAEPEAIELTWRWPGFAGNGRRRRLSIDEEGAHRYATQVADGLGPRASAYARAGAYVSGFVAALEDDIRASLFAAAYYAGHAWAPSSDPVINAAWQEWFIHAHAEQGREARERGGVFVEAVPKPARRRRHEPQLSVARSASTVTSEPYDAARNAEELAAAVRRMDEVDAVADEINRRVAADLASWRPRSRATEQTDD